MTINLCFHGIGEPERELELDEDFLRRIREV